MLTKTLDFRGHRYQIAYVETFPSHPSWYSFEDERDVRERHWDIQPGDYVLDVGAAYGSYSLTALACGASHVIAWSPQGPPNEEPERAFLKRSCELNGWGDRIRIFDFGAFDRSGWLNTVTQDFSEYADEPTDKKDVIFVGSIDGTLRRRLESSPMPERVWMKLDVEGAEVEVLRGARQFLRKARPKILVENHLFKRATIEQEVRDLLTDWGYAHVATTPYHSVSHSLYEPCAS